MRKILFMITILLMAGTLPAQEEFWSNPPNLEKIKSEVNTKSSPHYYPKLVKRLAKADTTLNESDYEALYYGQAYQKNYSPYGSDDNMDAMRKMMRQDTLTSADVKKFLSHADAYIKDYPADPQVYYYKFVVQNYAKQIHGANADGIEDNYYRFVMLSRALVGSGDGRSTEHAMYVVSTAHEYFIMNMLDVQMRSQSLIYDNGHKYDLIHLWENEEGLDSLWFNVDICFNWLNKALPFEKPQATDPEKIVTSVDIPLNSWFDIEVVKVKNKKSQFRVIELLPLNVALDNKRGDGLKAQYTPQDDSQGIVFDSILNDDVPLNHIQGYFCKTKFFRSSEKEQICLMFKANTAETPLLYDTFIKYIGSDKFQTTSNDGIFRGVKMNEIWNDEIQTLRISNIRKDK